MRPTRSVALALLLALAAQAAHAERKALVIGNAHYAEGRLANPINDAEDMQTRLKALGFAVVLLEDAVLEDFDRALERFGQSLRAEDDAVFYFAGHGAQSNGVNYLIPTDAKISEDADLKYKAVNLGLALDKLAHAQNGFKLAILDACRNNPYARSLRDGSRGLARVDAPSGTLVWYAAQPGKVAEDGLGRNGAFTAQLLDALSQPGLDPDALFKRTARAVYQQTGGRQFPYPEGVSLVDFHFAAGTNPTAKPLALDPAAVELSFWDSIKASDNPADFEEYLKQYPQGRFAGLARNRFNSIANEELKQKIEIETTRIKEDLENYDLGSIKFVGTIPYNNTLWGLLKISDGTINRVRMGNYIGRNFGKIILVKEDKIELQELVFDDSGKWHSRKKIMYLSVVNHAR